MKFIIISLFIAVLLNSYIGIKHYYCLIRSKITKEDVGELLSTPVKPLDCFPCFSFWVSVIAVVIASLFGVPLTIYEPATIFLIAHVIDKL